MNYFDSMIFVVSIRNENMRKMLTSDAAERQVKHIFAQFLEESTYWFVAGWHCGIAP
jgi:hypothetical protein